MNEWFDTGWDQSEEIKSVQKAYSRLAEKFNAEMWKFLAEVLDEFEDEVRADEREQILFLHREIDVDNSCGDPDCCGGPYPFMVCELCAVEYPCPTVTAIRGGEQE